MKIAINGFGRIGRLTLRSFLENFKGTDLEFVAINDLSDPADLAYLFEFDSSYGRFKGDVKSGDGFIEINGNKIKVCANRDPENLPWGELGVDIVVECTGFFRTKELASKHLKAGAKRVLISAPAKDEIDGTFVYGVNHEDFNPKTDLIISNASCTTNCLAPVVKVLDKVFGIESGLMSTVHSYTGDQKLLDASHSDPRRGRSAAESIVPTSTGAAKAIGLVLPQLNGKLDGVSFRVPTPTVSLVDFTFQSKKSLNSEEVNGVLKEASEDELKGVLGFEERPLVSIDYRGDLHSSIVDPALTRVTGKNLCKITTWYDNEFAYATRLVDLLNYIASR